MKVVQLFKIYNFDVVQKFIWPKIQELKLKTLKGFWILGILSFSKQIHFKHRLKSKFCCHALNALNFCKNTLHKSYKLHNLFNITIERTLHKIIITHITFYNYKKILFKQFKHMTHDLVLITLNWLFKTLGRYTDYRVRPLCTRTSGQK